eukprot:3127708-Rhodomonas_salina.2
MGDEPEHGMQFTQLRREPDCNMKYIVERVHSATSAEEARVLLRSLQEVVLKAHTKLDSLLDSSHRSSRKRNLLSLEDQIGKRLTGREWWTELKDSFDTFCKWGGQSQGLDEWLEEAGNPDSPPIRDMRNLGWTEEDSIVFQCLSSPPPSLAIALGLRERVPTFSACTYAGVREPPVVHHRRTCISSVCTYAGVREPPVVHHRRPGAEHGDGV